MEPPGSCKNFDDFVRESMPDAEQAPRRTEVQPSRLRASAIGKLNLGAKAGAAVETNEEADRMAVGQYLSRCFGAEPLAKPKEEEMHFYLAKRVRMRERLAAAEHARCQDTETALHKVRRIPSTHHHASAPADARAARAAGP